MRYILCAAALVAVGSASIGSAWIAGTSASAASCEFAPVKKQIDDLLDHDTDLGAKFRAEVKDGWDSITVLEKLVSPQMSEQIDLCRFDVGEYLAKRGFPPAH